MLHFKKIALFGLLVFAAIIGYTQLQHNQSATSNDTKPSKSAVKPVPVVTTQIEQQTLPIWVMGLGTVTPQHQVVVRSRIDGELIKIHFNEGQMVRQGQRLADIDPRPLQAQLAQQKAQQLKDQAILNNALLDLKRFQQLNQEDAIAHQQLDTQQALVKQHQATLAADQAQIKNTELQLNYCNISAPISGRIGFRQIDVGNQIKVSDSNGIASITQLSPIMVTFSIPEQHLPSLLAARQSNTPLIVEAWDRNNQQLLTTGELASFDNQIDINTGSIKLKARFANQDERLYPNQFINARLRIGEYSNALTIPKEAILLGANGSFIYVVDEEMHAQAITVSVIYTNASLAVISGSIRAGQKIVIEGADKLKNGSKVEPIEQKAKHKHAETPPKAS